MSGKRPPRHIQQPLAATICGDSAISTFNGKMTMTAYLDYNIFTAIEDGDFSINKIFDKVDKHINNFPFSAAHIQEVDNIFADTDELRDSFIAKRLNTIKQITNCSYIFQEIPSNKIYWLTEEPTIVLETIRHVPFAKTSMKIFMNFISNEQKEHLRQTLGINTKELNNYSPKQVIQHLNTKLTNWGTQDNFLQLLDKAISFHPNKKDFGQHNNIAGVMELLDMLGYWKDKVTETSNYARLWDSNHIHFASYCDYLISDDKRLRYKAKVVYDIYSISTKIVSSNGIE